MTPHKSNCFFQQFQITVIFSQFYHALVSWGPNGHSQCLKSRLLLYQKITLKQFYFIFKIRILLPFINCQWNTNGIKQNELSKLFIIGLLIFPNILKLKKLKMSEKNLLYDSLGMYVQSFWCSKETWPKNQTL